MQSPAPTTRIGRQAHCIGGVTLPEVLRCTGTKVVTRKKLPGKPQKTPNVNTLRANRPSETPGTSVTILRNTKKAALDEKDR